jgi:hypothetical protein
MYPDGFVPKGTSRAGNADYCHWFPEIRVAKPEREIAIRYRPSDAPLNFGCADFLLRSRAFSHRFDVRTQRS